jgi:N-methylhydantoinase B
MNLILSNVRTPHEREGDFAAQIMANTIGVRRMKEMISKYGYETLTHYAKALMDYSEAVIRRTIRDIPDGSYTFSDVIEDDGMGTENIRIAVRLTVKDDYAELDFSQTDDQAKGSINAVRAITLSAVLYVFRSLVSQDIPTNDGCMRPIHVITRKGSLVDANFPAAVAGGNVETSQRIVDVVLGALAQAIPNRIPAASQGTMNNVAIGGIDSRTGRPFSYYETIAGGMGARNGGSGESAVHSHMTNTLNTPIEALEYSYPFRVTCYAIRRNTGGDGNFKGGDGLVREIEVLSPCEVTVISERRKTRPYGLSGGEPGSPGENALIQNGEVVKKGGKFQASLQPGDRVRSETPGGGGYGK